MRWKPVPPGSANLRIGSSGNANPIGSFGNANTEIGDPRQGMGFGPGFSGKSTSASFSANTATVIKVAAVPFRPPLQPSAFSLFPPFPHVV